MSSARFRSTTCERVAGTLIAERLGEAAKVPDGCLAGLGTMTDREIGRGEVRVLADCLTGIFCRERREEDAHRTALLLGDHRGFGL